MPTQISKIPKYLTQWAVKLLFQKAGANDRAGLKLPPV